MRLAERLAPKDLYRAPKYRWVNVPMKLISMNRLITASGAAS